MIDSKVFYAVSQYIGRITAAKIIPKINYNKLVKSSHCFTNWGETSKPIVLGKMTVIKTLVLSLLNHSVISLPNPTNFYCKEVEKLFFVWNGSTHRVKKRCSYKELYGWWTQDDYYQYIYNFCENCFG